MNYKLLIFGLLTLLLLPALSMATTNYIFNDSFTRADNAVVGNGWVEAGGSTVDIVSNRLRLYDASAGGENSIAYHTFTGTKNLNVSFKYEQNSNNAFYMNLKDSSDDYVLRFYSSGSQFGIYTGSSYNYITGLSSTNEYQINLTNFDFTAKTVDVYVDGVDKGNFAFEANLIPSKITFSHADAATTGTAYIDDVFIYNITANPISPNFSVSVTDEWNSSDVNNINVTVYEAVTDSSNDGYTDDSTDTNPSFWRDGNWSTASSKTSASFKYVNYTQPSNASNTDNLFFIRYQNEDYVISPATSYADENLSIPSSCLTTNNFQARLSATSNTELSGSTLSVDCYTGSSWTSLLSKDVNNGLEGLNFYEQQVIWNEPNSFLNATGNTVTTTLLQNDTSTYLVQVSANDYFSKNYSNTNVSSNLAATLHQNIISFTVEDLNDDDIEANITIDAVTKTTSETWYLNSGTHTLTISKTGYYDLSTSITLSSLENKTIALTGLYNSIINVTAQEAVSSTPITGFEGWYYNNNNSVNNTFTTITTFEEISAMQGNTYQIYADSDNYSSAIETINASSSLVNITLDLFFERSIFITFKDIFTGEIVNTTTITLDLISDYYSANYSTTNGTLYPKLLIPANYNARYGATGYASSFYNFLITADSSENVTLYLVNASSTTDVLVKVVDQTGAIVEGAIVKAQRYDVASNNYLLYEVGQTSFSGETLLHLTLNDEFFKFIIEINGLVVKTTLPSYITSTEIVLQVQIGENVFTNYFPTYDLSSDLIFNTLTNNFRWQYNDPTGTTNDYCLKLYLKEYDGTTLINTSCSTSSSATILLPATNTTGANYEAIAYLNDEIVDSEGYTFPEVELGQMGLFAQFLLTLAFMGIALWSIELLPISIGVSFIFGRMLNFTSLSWVSITALFVVMIIISWIINKYRS